MRSLPKWLLDPLGPLSIPPAYLPKLLPWLLRFWRAGAAGALRGEPRRAGRHDAARRSRVGGPHAALRHAATCCARTARSNSTRARPSFRPPLPGWAGPAALRHRATAISTATGSPSSSPACRRASPTAPSCRAGRRSATPRTLGKAIWRHAESRGANFCPAMSRLAVPSQGQIAIQLKAGRTVLARQSGHRRRRLVASAGPAVRRPYPAGDRARLQHDAADVRLRPEAAC